MSLKRVKSVFDNMSNAQDVLLQILQINTSKAGNISYIVRPIIFEPVDRMKQFLLEIREKYIDDKKGFDASFSSCIDYDGTADGKTIYHLSTDNVLINTEYNALTNACIFRKNCASVPEERSAIPLQTEQSSAG